MSPLPVVPRVVVPRWKRVTWPYAVAYWAFCGAGIGICVVLGI